MIPTKAIHIDAKEEDIKKTVIVAGDPLRVKYIAEHFLEESYPISHTRGMIGYTGKYKGKEITIFPHGMGCPSMGIYAYELYHFYHVDTIIRVGTCGANQKDIQLLDLVIADSSYCLSNFPKLFFDDNELEFFGTENLNNCMEKIAIDHKISYHRGKIMTNDIFDVYAQDQLYQKKLQEKFSDSLATEMEAASLFALAKHLKKQAACLLTVVDSPYIHEYISSEKREKSLNQMIEIALEMAHNL